MPQALFERHTEDSMESWSDPPAIHEALSHRWWTERVAIWNDASEMMRCGGAVLRLSAGWGCMSPDLRTPHPCGATLCRAYLSRRFQRLHAGRRSPCGVAAASARPTAPSGNSERSPRVAHHAPKMRTVPSRPTVASVARPRALPGMFFLYPLDDGQSAPPEPGFRARVADTQIGRARWRSGVTSPSMPLLQESFSKPGAKLAQTWPKPKLAQSWSEVVHIASSPIKLGRSRPMLDRTWPGSAWMKAVGFFRPRHSDSAVDRGPVEASADDNIMKDELGQDPFGEPPSAAETMMFGRSTTYCATGANGRPHLRQERPVGDEMASAPRTLLSSD